MAWHRRDTEAAKIIVGCCLIADAVPMLWGFSVVANAMPPVARWAYVSAVRKALTMRREHHLSFPLGLKALLR